MNATWTSLSLKKEKVETKPVRTFMKDVELHKIRKSEPKKKKGRNKILLCLPQDEFGYIYIYIEIGVSQIEFEVL